MNLTTKIEKLQAKKVLGMKLAESFRRLGYEAKALRVEQCGTYLEFAQTAGGKNALTAANFCRERLCPACGWMRSCRIYATTSRILDYIDTTRSDHKYLFLTLTVRNCPPDKLGETLTMMAAAYNRMKSNRAWKRRILGAMRTTEITINHEAGTMHPHYHLILMVPKSYGRKGDDLYLSQAEWADLWRLSARLDYAPMVWVEAIKGGREKGIMEVSKYLAKAADYILPDDPAATDYNVSILQEHVGGRQLISYSGELRRVQKLLKLEDPEGGDLTEATTIRGDVITAIRKYHWSAGLSRYVPGLPQGGR